MPEGFQSQEMQPLGVRLQPDSRDIPTQGGAHPQEQPQQPSPLPLCLNAPQAEVAMRVDVHTPAMSLQPTISGPSLPPEGQNPPPSSWQPHTSQLDSSSPNTSGVSQLADGGNPPPNTQPHPISQATNSQSMHAGGQSPSPSSHPLYTSQPENFQLNPNAPAEGRNFPPSTQLHQVPQVTDSKPNINGKQVPANGQDASSNSPSFRWPPFEPLSFESNPFLLQSLYPNKANEHATPDNIPAPVPVLGKRSQKTSSPPASNFKQRRARSAEPQPPLRDPASTPLTAADILTILAVRDQRNREDLLSDFRSLVAQTSVHQTSTASTSTPRSTSTPGPSASTPSSAGPVTSPDSAGSTAAGILTQEKILQLIMPLLSRGEYALYCIFYRSLIFRRGTSRSTQPAPDTEDIEMDVPPANATEVAAALFVEMQKYMINGKHVNCIP
jgi:hypothetical protein